MAKGQQRSNREARKPKKDKPKETPAASPFAQMKASGDVRAAAQIGARGERRSELETGLQLDLVALEIREVVAPQPAEDGERRERIARRKRRLESFPSYSASAAARPGRSTASRPLTWTFHAAEIQAFSEIFANSVGPTRALALESLQCKSFGTSEGSAPPRRGRWSVTR